MDETFIRKLYGKTLLAFNVAVLLESFINLEIFGKD